MTKEKLTFNWVSSKEHDAARILGTYSEVKNKFFQTHHFLVLPYPNGEHVYLPDLNYGQLKLSRSSTYHPKDYKEETIQTVLSQLEGYPFPESVSLSEIQEVFNVQCTPMIRIIGVLFPALVDKISSITIISTPFGTTGSFDYKKKGKQYDLFIWIRTTGLNPGRIISHLVHCLVSAFVLVATKISDDLPNQWRERETIVDFLMEHSALKSVVPDLPKTLQGLQSKQKPEKLVEDSQQFVGKLTRLTAAPHVSIKDGNLFIERKKIESLTQTEGRLITILLGKQNRFVSKDELFEGLYNNEGGTDWSLSKHIERVRNKIERAGIFYPVLITSRNRGYKLVTSEGGI